MKGDSVELLFQNRYDVDLTVQGAVHGALVGDFQQPLALAIVKHTVDAQDPLETVDLAGLGFAGGAVSGVYLAVGDGHADLVQRPLPLPGVHS